MVLRIITNIPPRNRKRVLYSGSILFVLSLLTILIVISRKGFTFPWLNPLMLQTSVATKGIEELQGHHTEHCHIVGYSNFPKIVHQSWKTNILPKHFGKLSDSWKICFPDWRYLLWTDGNNREFIETHYSWFLSRYDSYPLNIHRADAVRYFYMYHYGGIYSDLDNECLHKFDMLLVNASIVFGAMDYSISYDNIPEGLVQNSFMFSRPRHPFWLHVIREMCQRNWGYPERMTGPKVLENVISEYRRHCGSRAVTIYPPELFNPFSWANYKGNACRAHGQMSDTYFAQCKHRFNKSYVIQYHAHTWSS